MKVRSFALGIGSVETASYAHMLLVHRKGFNSVEEALLDLHNVVHETLYYEPIMVDNEYMSGKQLKEHLDGLSADEMEQKITYATYEIVHGTLQDYGELWEILDAHGWNTCSPWIVHNITKYPMIFLDTAPELIAAAKHGWDDLDEWQRSCVSGNAVCAKKVTFFKKDVKRAK